MHYNQNRRYYAGEVQISLKMIRLDKDPIGSPPYAFRKTRRRCAWDSVLSWQSLTIMGSIVIILIVVFFGLCVCSNSSCHDESHSNWCCLFCACCRRRRRALPSRPLMDPGNSQNQTQMNNHNHHAYSNHTRHAPPPPPPPPPSSMNSSRNQTTYSRKPTFSTASYSYDGNGSNPTGQSSSAMSTALETDDNNSDSPGHTPTLDSSQFLIAPTVCRLLIPFSFTPVLTLSRANGHLLHRAQLILPFISADFCLEQMELYIGLQIRITLKCHWLGIHTRQMLLQPIQTIELHTTENSLPESVQPNATISAGDQQGNNVRKLLYLCLMYWHLQKQILTQTQSNQPRDLYPTKLPSKVIVLNRTSSNPIPVAMA